MVEESKWKGNEEGPETSVGNKRKKAKRLGGKVIAAAREDGGIGEFVAGKISSTLSAMGKSERDLSLKLGRSPSYINGIVSGRISPSLEALYGICEALDITLAMFFRILEERSHCILLCKKWQGQLTACHQPTETLSSSSLIA